jgi:hypothetical protein
MDGATCEGGLICKTPLDLRPIRMRNRARHAGASGTEALFEETGV